MIEAQALFSNSLFSNPNIGHTLMGTQLNTDPTDIALKNMQNQMFAHQTYQLPTPQWITYDLLAWPQVEHWVCSVQ